MDGGHARIKIGRDEGAVDVMDRLATTGRSTYKLSDNADIKLTNNTAISQLPVGTSFIPLI